MTEHVEIRKGDSVASLVDQLATSVKQDSLTLPADRAIADGEWVRFTLKLADGTDVMEGVGQSRGSMPRGNPVDHHDVVLGELSFDERNEIMWERLLIAAEAAQRGDETGTIQLSEESVEAMVDAAGSGAPAKSANGGAGAKAGAPPPVPKASPSTAPKASPSGAPKAAPSTAPKPAGASNPPPPSTTAKASFASKPPPASQGRQLAVAEDLVARARKLAAMLPRESFKKNPNERPEDAVLAAALRMGLAALEAQKA